MSAVPSLKKFLATLDGLLSPLDEEQLRSVLVRYAGGLPAGARTTFLEDLKALCTPGPAAPKDLIGEIERFIADVKSGMYYDDWGWDPDLRHERAFGDESWAPRMDKLFAEAATAFLSARYELSATAHLLLFGALALEDDEGALFSYESSPAESLTTELAEAGARLLRSLYEVAADPGEAAENMADAWLNRLPYGSRPDSLLAVREALPTDLRDLGAFYSCWTRTLVERSGGLDPLRSRLLRETATITGNVEALAEAARKPGPGQPAAYLDLANSLCELHDDAAALNACREGLDLLTTGDRDGWTAYQWAPLADLAATLAPAKEAVEFRAQAFTLAVSTRRLVALHGAAEAYSPGSGGLAAGEAADRLAAGTGGLAHYHLPNFRAQALLLAGRADDALGLLPPANALANDTSDTTLTVLPYVLTASCGAVTHRDWEHTVLRALVGRTAKAAHTVSYDEHRDDADAALAGLLEQTLRRQVSTAAGRAGWRRTARATIDRWIRATLGQQQRAMYGDAARLAAALTEAEIITDGESAYLDSVLETYRRYHAFRREAAEVRKGSVLL